LQFQQSKIFNELQRFVLSPVDVAAPPKLHERINQLIKFSIVVIAIRTRFPPLNPHNLHNLHNPPDPTYFQFRDARLVAVDDCNCNCNFDPAVPQVFLFHADKSFRLSSSVSKRRSCKEYESQIISTAAGITTLLLLRSIHILHSENRFSSVRFQTIMIDDRHTIMVESGFSLCINRLLTHAFASALSYVNFVYSLGRVVTQ
jgi:hypothetical protein